MKKKVKFLMLLLITVFAITPFISVKAESKKIEYIILGGEITSITEGDTLSSYTVNDYGAGYIIEEFGTELTCWLAKKTKSDSWINVNNNVASGYYAYALGIKIKAEDGYEFDSKPEIKYNGNTQNDGYDYYYEGDSNSGYVIINLGPAIAQTIPDPETPNEPQSPTYYTITYDANGGEFHSSSTFTMQDKVEDGTTIDFPSEIEWYIEHPSKFKELDYFLVNGERVEIGSSIQIHANTAIKAIWKDIETDDYRIENNRLILEFKEKKDQEFSLFTLAMLNATDEDLMFALEMEEYDNVNDVRNDINEVVDEYKQEILTKIHNNGDLLDIYMIELMNVTDDNDVEKGPFDIKIKLTDEMKKYNTFKLYCIDEIDDDDDYEEEIVELTVEGDYIVGTLQHLSTYALFGSYETPTNTGDHILLYVLLGLVCVVGIISLKKIKR